MKKGYKRENYVPDNEYYTPAFIFEALKLEFDLDPCSPESGACVPAKQKYVLPLDGLAEPWFGLVWVNPPYSNAANWVDKWLDHGNGLLLVPSAKSKWRHRLWNDDRTKVTTGFQPKFIRPNKKPHEIMFNIDIWSIGERAYQALLASNLGRVR